MNVYVAGEIYAKKVSETSTVMSQMMQPEDANVAGNVHGRTIIKLIDNAAGVVAVRHCRSNAVTASVDRIDFHNPAYIGDLLIVKASLTPGLSPEVNPGVVKIALSQVVNFGLSHRSGPGWRPNVCSREIGVISPLHISHMYPWTKT